MATKEEYINAAYSRIADMAKNLGVEIPGMLSTAILVELRTMYESGAENKFKDIGYHDVDEFYK